MQTPKMNAWPNEHSVLVMDNCRIHDKPWLYEWADWIGAGVEFIPPYSPQFNPIEKVFGIVEHYLKTHAHDLRDITAVEAIGLALDDASVGNKCKNFILNTPGQPYSFLG
jgi:transposase